MAGKFSRSWALIKASAAILRSDKALMVFPLFSGIASAIVALSFIWPIATIAIHQEQAGGGETMSPAFYLLLFAFYLVQYFVIIFFNTALVGAALIRLGGGTPTVRDGMQVALSRLPTIFGYALISATVGMILRALQERFGLIGRIVVGVLGFGWTVATFLVVPVLASQDIGPVKAVKRSVELLRRTWGENLIGTVGMGFVFGLISFVVILVGMGIVFSAFATQSIALIVLAIAVAVVAVISIAMIQSALHGIYSAALYRFAEEGNAGAGFEHALLEGAFRAKK
jgi:hypothetical protein